MQMGGNGSVIGWKLDREQRRALLEQFEPHYDEPVADHVTLEVKAQSKPLPVTVESAIVGRSDDGQGVQVMIVSIDGTTDRPDGSTYHITWSLAPGRQAKESNDVIRERGWSTIHPPVPVTLEPARF
jgi:hypothetical protein